MANIEQELHRLRETVAYLIANLEVWDSLDDVCNALGLPAQENSNGLPKAKYLLKITSEVDDPTIITASKKILRSYPGNRTKPSDSNLQSIQDALWWIESGCVQKISNVTRYSIIESLERTQFWGRLPLRDFFAPVMAIVGSLPEIGRDGYLYEGLSANALLGVMFGRPLQEPPLPPARLNISEFLKRNGAIQWPDQRFCLLLERIASPEVQSPSQQRKFVDLINSFLQEDSFGLEADGLLSGLPVYKVRKCSFGVSGSPKYIIFASSGIKPDIVVEDVVSMDIRIVRHAEQCLVYDEPPTNGDLTWKMLLEWWGKQTGLDVSNTSVRQNFGARLRQSLQSEPERLLFDTYFREFKPKYGDRLPALLPQVYLHYDPISQKARGKPVLVRQRMDFLMLLRNSVRVVIEVDGKQHYSDADGKASPQLYAEMVAEDRRIRCLGYEIYRFGGAEFLSDTTKIIVTFFEDLFERHGI